MCLCKRKNKYLIDGRLEDVLALIQVLALDEDSHRSERGLQKELIEKPKSAESWQTLAIEHPEFFRVEQTRKFPISLVTRHVSESSGKKRPPLQADVTQSLLNAAIELHDRQLKRSQRWTVLIPIWVAVIGGLFLILKEIFFSCINK
ncbi:MAG: hypothetical protein ACYSR0_09735 [Planctomycetota bacterium]|jgi:hypothetical protein